MDGSVPQARHSLVTRWTLGVLVAGLVGLFALFLVVDRIVADNTRDVVARGVDTDLAGLVDIYATSGRAELAARIDDRVSLPGDAADTRHYLLASAEGRPIAGDIAQWPPLSAETSENGWIALPDIGPVHARTTMVEPGVRLMVAHGYAGREALRQQIRLGFAATSIALLALLFGWSWWSARGLRGRVEAINRRLREVGNDNSAEPADAPPEHRDELGELSLHVGNLKRRISAVLHSQRQITDNLAHEIRTPLIHLDNKLLDLLDRPEFTGASEPLSVARGDIREVVSLLEALLDIAANEARSGDRSGMESFDLSESLARLVDLFSDSAEDLGLDFTADIAPAVTIRGDRALMQRLVANLLDNAFKFTPAGGQVNLSLLPGPVISITDSGPGVPAALQGRIFERFERADASVRGHGLGLALARAIADRHDLDLSLDDSYPQGARFVIAPKKGQP